MLPTKQFPPLPISSVLNNNDRKAAAAGPHRRAGPLRGFGLKPGLQRAVHPYRRAIDQHLAGRVGDALYQQNNVNFDQNPWSKEAVSTIKNVTKSMTSSIGRALGGLWVTSTRNADENAGGEQRRDTNDINHKQDDSRAMSVDVEDAAAESQSQPQVGDDGGSQLLNSTQSPNASKSAAEQLKVPLSEEPPKINWKGKAAPQSFDLNAPVVSKKPSIMFDPTDSLSIIAAYKEALRLENEAKKAEEVRKEAETARRAEAIERRRGHHERKPSTQQEIKQLVDKRIEKKRKLSVSGFTAEEGPEVKREKVENVNRRLDPQMEVDEHEVSARVHESPREVQSNKGHKKTASTMSTMSTRSTTDNSKKATSATTTTSNNALPRTKIEFTSKPILDWSDIPADRIDRQGIFSVDFDYSDDDEVPEPPKAKIATPREALLEDEIIIPRRYFKRPTEEDPDVVKRRAEIAAERSAADKKKVEEKNAVPSGPAVSSTVEPSQKPDVIPLLGKPSVGFTQGENVKIPTPSSTFSLNVPVSNETKVPGLFSFGSKAEAENKRPDEKTTMAPFSFQPTNGGATVNAKEQGSAPLFGSINGKNGSLFGSNDKKDEPRVIGFGSKIEEPSGTMFGGAKAEGSKPLFGGFGVTPKPDEVEKSTGSETTKLPSFSFGSKPGSSLVSTFGSGDKDKNQSEAKPAEAPGTGAFQFKLPQLEDKATSTSPLSFGQKSEPAASITTTTTTSAAVSFGLPSTTGSSASSFAFGATAPKESENKPFAFGTTSTTSNESENNTAAFGAAATPKEPESKGFAFGAAATPKEPESKAFSFGTAATPKEPESKPFTFGAPVAAPKESKPKPFAFGAPVAAPKESDPKPFAFGASVTAKENETKPFAFGAAAVTPKEGENKQFAFGVPGTAPTETQTKPFAATFGAATTAKESENKPFAFGAPAPANPTSSPFGAPAGAGPTGAFPFGSSTTPGATPGATSGTTPGTGFGFGSQPAQPQLDLSQPGVQQAGQPFAFGQSTAQTPGSTSAFSFGGPTAAPPAAVFGFGGQSAPSTPFGSPAQNPGVAAAGKNMFASGTTGQTTPAGRKMAPMRRRLRR